MSRKKLMHGVGINDVKSVTKYSFENGKYKLVWRCPYYVRWCGMLERCYSKRYQKNQPTYVGCSVCKEWLTLSNFKSWMETQDWENKQLDKDLLIYQNKVYSPETCCFIPREVNLFLTRREKNRGLYPLGVSYKIKPQKSIAELTKPFLSNISIDSNDTYLGHFNTPEEAHRMWQKAKIERAEVLKKEQTDIRIISGLQRIINKIQNDYDNNLETVDF